MTDIEEQALGFAPAHDQPVPYLARLREYYSSLGYDAPYRWAQYVDVPFTPLTAALGSMTVALITTAAPYQPDKGDPGPGAPYNASAKFFTVYSGDSAVDHDLRISHISYDRQHTSAEDMNTWFPLPALRRAAIASRWLGPVLRSGVVRRTLATRVRRGPSGPSEEERQRGASLLWGEAVAANGQRAEARLRGASGYVLTAQTAVHLAAKALGGQAPVGFQTPSLAYGADVILERPGVTRADVT